MNEIIELRNVTFSYSEEDARPALNNVSLTIQQGEWIAIIGPNGSGKSTLAKTINGLIEANSGEVIIEGVALNAETVWDVRKKIGMVFQSYDLFPHLTILQNVTLAPIKVKKRNRREVEKEALELLEHPSTAPPQARRKHGLTV